MTRRVSRRTLLKSGATGMTGILAGCSQTNQAPEETGTSPESPPNSDDETDPSPTTDSESPLDDLPETFIRRDGTEFTVDGEQYVFAGVANCCLVENYTSQTRIQDVLNDAAELGANALRFKIGCAGGGSDCGDIVDGCNVCFQPEPGTYDDTAFEHLDYIVSEAGKRGIRVILPLVDNWGQSGMDQYVAWSDTASDHDDFYTDDQAQELYRGFVETLLTRTNSITGREFREDPTILMWELANEPRVDDAYEGFLEWMESTAEFIHDLDGNHLVSTGSDIYEEEVYVEVHNIDGIDAASIHLWPDHWGHEDDAAAYGDEYIRNRVERGHEDVGKPVYLGEYGWTVNLQSDDREEQLQHRSELFQQWHETALDTELDGAIAWELLSESRLRYHREEPGQGETVGFAYPDHENTVQELQSFMNQFQTGNA